MHLFNSVHTGVIANYLFVYYKEHSSDPSVTRYQTLPEQAQDTVEDDDFRNLHEFHLARICDGMCWTEAAGGIRLLDHDLRRHPYRSVLEIHGTWTEEQAPRSSG